MNLTLTFRTEEFRGGEKRSKGREHFLPAAEEKGAPHLNMGWYYEVPQFYTQQDKSKQEVYNGLVRVKSCCLFLQLKTYHNPKIYYYHMQENCQVHIKLKFPTASLFI